MTWDYTIAKVNAESSAQAAELVMDAEAFTDFYRRTARPLWAYLARVSGDGALADDLLQESYVRFLGASLRADGEVAYRRYLFRIATNLLRDHWRHPVVTSLDTLPEGAVPAAAHQDPEQIDSLARLGPALARMRSRERQLLWLAYAEGYTHHEIAEITGLREMSIRLLLFRARRRLARLLRQRPMAPRESQ